MELLERWRQWQQGRPAAIDAALEPPLRSFDLTSEMLWETPLGPIPYRERAIPCDSLLAGREQRAQLETRRGALGTICPLLGSPSDWGYLDTETTGLSTGTGTLVWLVGAAWIEGDHLLVRQLWLPEPGREPAFLAAVQQMLAQREGWVTYNGQQYDLALLSGRMRLNGIDPEAAGLPAGPRHWDLLPLARRLWRRTLGSATLNAVEASILRINRGSDLPGAEAPARYLAWLHGTDPDARGLLDDVFRHNRYDLSSLYQLAVHLSWLLSLPPAQALEPMECEPLARLAASQRKNSEAIDYLEAALRAGASTAAAGEATTVIVAAAEQVTSWGSRSTATQMELAALYKRRGNWAEAVQLWQTVAAAGPLAPVEAYVELAKYYEHHKHDLASALAMVERAELLMQRRRSSRPTVHADLERRRRRLASRLS